MNSNNLTNEENVESFKYPNTLFNQSYYNMKNKILPNNTNKKRKKYIYSFIDKIFRIIEERYDNENLLHLNSLTYKYLFLSNFKKYMNAIIRILFTIDDKNKYHNQKTIKRISRYIYKNMCNDILYHLTKKTNKKNLLGFSSNKYLTEYISTPKNNSSINKNLKILFNKKIEEYYTFINDEKLINSNKLNEEKKIKSTI
jgi:hypothetical protein